MSDLTKWVIRFNIACWVVGLTWVAIFPGKPPQPQAIIPSTKPNIWMEAQKNRLPNPRVRPWSYHLDEPSQAWYEAEHYDDNDDPELYNDKYDGR
jgi:hypothetical protein